MDPWYLSKTTWALVVAVIGSIGALVGVHIDPLQMSSLITYLTDAGQAVTIIAPVIAGVLHTISKKKAQQAITQAQGQNVAAPPSKP